MHHFVAKFSKKIRLRQQGGIDPLTKILRMPLHIESLPVAGQAIDRLYLVSSSICDIVLIQQTNRQLID